MMIYSVTRRAIAALLVAILALATTFFVSPVADAQTTVTGTADFRNAPQLVDGQYADRLVTGDSAWYSLLYTNGTPYRFEVSIAGAAPSDVEVTASFVAPTLDEIDGPAAVVDGSGVAYPSGATNLWFLRVSLQTQGQDGIELPIRVRVEGALDASLADCSDVPGCTLDEELAEINRGLANAQTELDLLDPGNNDEAVNRELVGLRQSAESASTTTRPNAESRLAQAEARLAQACAPELTCDEIPTPAASTPLLGWLVGLAALAFGARVGLKKLAAARAGNELHGDNLDEDETMKLREEQSSAAEQSQTPIAL